MTLIDRFLPDFQFRERHARVAPAGRAADLLDAACRPAISDDPWMRGFVRLREAPGRWLAARGAATPFATRPAFGLGDFIPLGRDGDREVLFGLVGRFWRLDYGLVRLDGPEQYRRFAEHGVPKLALNVVAEPLPDGRVRLTTETRVYCNDLASRLRFAPYWFLIRPVSGLIRRRLLSRIAAAA